MGKIISGGSQRSNSIDDLLEGIAREKTENLLKRAEEDRSGDGIKTPEFRLSREERKEIFLLIGDREARMYIAERHADFAAGLALNSRGDSMLHLLVKDPQVAECTVRARSDLLDKTNYYGETIRGRIEKYHDAEVSVAKRARMTVRK